MAGIIAIVDGRPPAENKLQSRARLKTKYKVSVDGAVRSQSVGEPGQVEVDPGEHTVQVSIGGLRTNTVTVAVDEGGQHIVRIAPNERDKTQTLGLVGALIAGAKPGLAWRAEYPAN